MPRAWAEEAVAGEAAADDMTAALATAEEAAGKCRLGALPTRESCTSVVRPWSTSEAYGLPLRQRDCIA